MIGKARIGSDTFHLIQNDQSQGGIRIYAEVYKCFIEPSGLGLVNQAGELMNPPQAAHEFKIAEAIEAWEEKINPLARYGDDYNMPENFKMGIERYNLDIAARVEEGRTAANERMADIFDQTDFIICASNPDIAFPAHIE